MFQGSIASKSKFHITTGHDTVMGRLTFFGYYGNTEDTFTLASAAGALTMENSVGLDFNKEYLYQEELLALNVKPKPGEEKDAGSDGEKDAGRDGEKDAGRDGVLLQQLALIQFERPIICQNHALVIGSKLDTDIHTNLCRIAFHGKFLLGLNDAKSMDTVLPKLKVYKTKVKEGLVERVMDEYTVIGKNMFKKETNIATFTGLKVTLSTGEAGLIEGGFGQSGKIKIRIPGKT